MKRYVSLFLSVIFICLCFSGCGQKKPVRVAPLKRAYILAEKGNAYSIGLSAAFQSSFESMGGSVIMETFPFGTTDFSEYFKNANEKEASIIFAPNSVDVSKKILKTADKLKLKLPILAGEKLEDSAIQKAVNGTDLEVYFPVFFDEADTSNEVANKFIKGFKKFISDNEDNKTLNGGDKTVSPLSALGFDAYNVAVSAIKTAAKEKGEELTSVDIAKALWNVNYKKGVTGNITFDGNGDAIKDNGYIKKVLKNKFEFVKKQTFKNYTAKYLPPDYSEADGIKLDKQNKVITIGVYEPLTGDYSEYGNKEYLGIKYANSLNNKVKIGSEEYDVKLYVCDNRSDQDAVSQTALDIVNQNALITLGSYGYEFSVLAASTFADAAVPSIACSCLKASVTENSKWYFRVCYTDSFEGNIMAKFGWDLLS